MIKIAAFPWMRPRVMPENKGMAGIVREACMHITLGPRQLMAGMNTGKTALGGLHKPRRMDTAAPLAWIRHRRVPGDRPMREPVMRACMNIGRCPSHLLKNSMWDWEAPERPSPSNVALRHRRQSPHVVAKRPTERIGLPKGQHPSLQLEWAGTQPLRRVDPELEAGEHKAGKQRARQASKSRPSSPPTAKAGSTGKAWAKKCHTSTPLQPGGSWTE